MWQFQQAGIEAAADLVHLWHKSFAEAYADTHTAENIHSYCSRNYTLEAAHKILTDELTSCTLALRQGKYVGVTILTDHNCSLRPELNGSELKHLYLLSSEYGSGLGKVMMDRALIQTRKKNRSILWLCVSDLNSRARNFYHKFGFKRIGKGPLLEVGTDILPSGIMIFEL